MKLPCLIASGLLNVLMLVGQVRAADAVPPLLNYQGRLTDEAGQPLASGGYRLAFRVWAAATSTASDNLVWGREFEVTVVGGAFNVILNDAGQPAEPALTTELAGSFAGANRFLGLTVLRTPAGPVPVAQRKEIAPRQQLLSAPFAIEANHASIASSLVKELADALCPPGSILSFGGAQVPDGWLLCDGRAVSSLQYPRLFTAITTAWGDGSTDEEAGTDFNLPDLRGLFLRGVSGDRTNSWAEPPADVLSRTNAFPGGNFGAGVGSYQFDIFQNHAHDYSDSSTTGTYWTQATGGGGAVPLVAGSSSRRTTDPAGGSETRPKNAYVHFIIKH